MAPECLPSRPGVRLHPRPQPSPPPGRHLIFSGREGPENNFIGENFRSTTDLKNLPLSVFSSISCFRSSILLTFGDLTSHGKFALGVYLFQYLIANSLDFSLFSDLKAYFFSSISQWENSSLFLCYFYLPGCGIFFSSCFAAMNPKVFVTPPPPGEVVSLCGVLERGYWRLSGFAANPLFTAYVKKNRRIEVVRWQFLRREGVKFLPCVCMKLAFLKHFFSTPPPIPSDFHRRSLCSIVPHSRNSCSSHINHPCLCIMSTTPEHYSGTDTSPLPMHWQWIGWFIV